MNRPRLHQRVRVTDGPAKGIAGTVCRMLHRAEPASWVALDERVAEACAFSADVGDARATHALIQWDALEPA